MPHESRMIVFNDKEAADALHEFAVRQDRPVPERDGAEVHYSQEKGNGVKSRVHYPKKEHTAEFTDVETASALIAYCIDNGIPLPRRGQKSVYVRYEELALQVRLPDA